MYILKLKKGLSYRLGNIIATKAKPEIKIESEQDYEALMASGRFDLVEEIEDKKPIDEMGVDELKAYAEEIGVDLTGCSKKAEYIQKIEEALAKKASE